MDRTAATSTNPASIATPIPFRKPKEMTEYTVAAQKARQPIAGRMLKDRLYAAACWVVLSSFTLKVTSPRSIAAASCLRLGVEFSTMSVLCRLLPCWPHYFHPSAGLSVEAGGKDKH